MALSALSRTTSISNSFQPSTDSSISTSWVGEASSPRFDDGEEFLAVIGDAAAGAAQGEAEGRITAGRPDLSSAASALVKLSGDNSIIGIVRAVIDEIAGADPSSGAAGPSSVMPLGTSRPMAIIACLKSSRSSALSMASAVAPISSILWRSSAPILRKRQRGVERGLPAHGGQQREHFAGGHIGPLAGDDLLHEFRRDRFDIGGVRHVRDRS